MRNKPPAPLFPLPTVMQMRPPTAPAPSDVPIEMRPEVPELEVPELKTSAPANPALPALAVVTVMAPDDADSDVVQDSSSSSSSEDSALELGVEELGTMASELGWMLAKGSHGMLHLQTDDGLACNRSLIFPELGNGLRDAADTGRSWSPTCYKALPAVISECWGSNALEHNLQLRGTR